MQDGISNGGKRMQQTGYIPHKHIYSKHTYTGKAIMHVCTGKALQPTKSNNVHALMQFYLIDGTTTFTQKQRKDPLTVKGVDRVRGPL